MGSLPARPGHSRDTPVTETTWRYSRHLVEVLREISIRIKNWWVRAHESEAPVCARAILHLRGIGGQLGSLSPQVNPCCSDANDNALFSFTTWTGKLKEVWESACATFKSVSKETHSETMAYGSGVFPNGPFLANS